MLSKLNSRFDQNRPTHNSSLGTRFARVRIPGPRAAAVLSLGDRSVVDVAGVFATSSSKEHQAGIQERVHWGGS